MADNLVVPVLLLGALIILGIVGTVFFAFPSVEKNTSGGPLAACDYNSSTKTYIKTSPQCVINFLCIRGETAFHDNCGCGCMVGSNSS